MAVYSHDDLLMSWMLPSSLKGVASDWFYSLPNNSLWDFEEVRQAFYKQFASRREFKKNSNHLLTIKMNHWESLKHYVSYFQSQMAFVYNCNDDVAATAFVSGLQVTHSFYKHLVKYKVTKMMDILSRIQKYIQIEDAT